jgi:hypothetical protein
MGAPREHAMALETRERVGAIEYVVAEQGDAKSLFEADEL